MARAYSGRDGQLLLGDDLLVKVLNWSLTANVDMLETTSLNEHYRTFVPGIQSYSGAATILYYLQDDLTNDAGTLLRSLIRTTSTGISTSDTVTFTLRLKNGTDNHDVKFTAYITEVSYGVSVGDVVSANLNFQSTGALSEVTI